MRGAAATAALKHLTVPECPEELDYLRRWSLELARARTVGMNGPEPLTYQAVDAWARLTDRHPAPYEVEALFALDVAMRFPEEPKEPRETP
jgi:pyrroloquinoline quinone (PQQ) biosynthesis protein C